MKKVFLVLLIGSFVLTSCNSTRTAKFTQKPNEIVTTQSLKDFLKDNKNPKIVLRVPNSSSDVASDENVNYLYNVIENQFLTQGFVVRDRKLFTQIINNDNNNINYKELKEKSDTDLIIELTKIDKELKYNTNKYFDKNNNEKVDINKDWMWYGATVEFKIIMIGENGLAGVYKFNYTPCVDGCVIVKSKSLTSKERKALLEERKKGYKGVEKDEMEQFIKGATIKLINEIRK